MADLTAYVPSEKHKLGMFLDEHGVRKRGRPGVRPTTVEQAAEQEPTPEFTMICPARWNDRHPGKEATDLLRAAIRKGQIGYPLIDGLPQCVWARDPDDPSVVFAARRLSTPSNGYKAYPLTENQALLLKLEVR